MITNAGASSAPGRGQRGFTLIELMIALLLGLLVVGAAIGIFLSNRQTYSATESLGRVQENVRFAFELMARDIREAGGNPCGNHLPLVNVVNPVAGQWWTSLRSTQDAAGELVNPWRNTIRGYSGAMALSGVDFGSDASPVAAQRVPGTQAIELLAADDAVYSVRSHVASSSEFQLNVSSHTFAAGNIAIVCSPTQATVFQVSAAPAGIVRHAAGGSPGNCTANLGLPQLTCAGTTALTYPANSVIAKLEASRWYVGYNGRGGRSLYQSRLTAAGTTTVNQEVVEGVTGMDFGFLATGGVNYAAPAAATNWSNIVAVQVTMQLAGEARSGSTDGQPLTRSLTHIISIRNRNP